MKSAAATYVYNESVNLPIWVRYYSALFGEENLFVLDRSSDDGSTSALGKVKVVKIERGPFDELEKTKLMSAFHAELLGRYDCAIVSDCDELIAPDPAVYRDLNDYIDRMKGDYASAVGFDIMHMIDREAPIDLARPILSQRSYGRFSSPECKQLLSRVPIRWLPGLHSSDKKPAFDKNLYLFHLKLMDYSCAMRRQAVNRATVWSAASLAANHGAHHRFSIEEFVHEAFLVPIDLRHRNEIGPFAFAKEIRSVVRRTKKSPDDFYHLPMNVRRMAHIPRRFGALF